MDVGLVRDPTTGVEVAQHVGMPAVDDAAKALGGRGLDLANHVVDVVGADHPFGQLHRQVFVKQRHAGDDVGEMSPSKVRMTAPDGMPVSGRVCVASSRPRPAPAVGQPDSAPSPAAPPSRRSASRRSIRPPLV